MWWHANPTESGKWFSEKFPERKRYIDEHVNEQTHYSAGELKDMLEAYRQMAVQQGIS
jgi:hypothetical protein